MAMQNNTEPQSALTNTSLIPWQTLFMMCTVTHASPLWTCELKNTSADTSLCLRLDYNQSNLCSNSGEWCKALQKTGTSIKGHISQSESIKGNERRRVYMFFSCWAQQVERFWLWFWFSYIFPLWCLQHNWQAHVAAVWRYYDEIDKRRRGSSTWKGLKKKIRLGFQV